MKSEIIVINIEAFTKNNFPLGTSALKIKSNKGFDKIRKFELQVIKEIKSIIKSQLGKNYVNILFQDSNWENEGLTDYKLLCHLFYEEFTQNEKGIIMIESLEDCKKKFTCREPILNNDNTVDIGVDYVYQNHLVYRGQNFENKNVLLFGSNLNENKHAKKLFEHCKPKRVFNIILIEASNRYKLSGD